MMMMVSVPSSGSRYEPKSASTFDLNFWSRVNPWWVPSPTPVLTSAAGSAFIYSESPGGVFGFKLKPSVQLQYGGAFVPMLQVAFIMMVVALMLASTPVALARMNQEECKCHRL